MKNILKIVLVSVIFLISFGGNKLVAQETDNSATAEVVVASADDEVAVDEVEEPIELGKSIKKFAQDSGIYALFADKYGWKYLVMICIACLLFYLAIVKKFEPLLLLPIAFGMLLTNIPGAGLYTPELFADGHVHWQEFANGAGLLDYL